MPKFIPYDHNQTSMVMINYQDHLQQGAFEHAIYQLMTKRLDLSVSYPHYQNDEGGRPAYGPAVLLSIILFAYSKGITSSREILIRLMHNQRHWGLACILCGCTM